MSTEDGLARGGSQEDGRGNRRKAAKDSPRVSAHLALALFVRVAVRLGRALHLVPPRRVAARVKMHHREVLGHVGVEPPAVRRKERR